MVKFKVACQLIQWAGEQNQNLEKVLKEVADAGYDGVEGLVAASPEELVELATTAAKFGLHIVKIGAPNLEYACQFNLTLGNDVVEIDACDRQNFGGQNPNEEDYRRAAESIGERCALARSYGLRPVHHAHLGTMIETTEDAESMLRYAPDLCLLFDTGHMAAANSNPMHIIQSYGDRIAHVHLKDVKAKDPKGWKREGWEEGRFGRGRAAWFEELGKGNLGLDIPGVLRALENAGYDGWISVEQDQVTGHSPAETARINRMYLRSLGY